MDNPEKLATYGIQDVQKQNTITCTYNVNKIRALLTSHVLCNHFQMLEAKKSELESPEYIAAMSTENINKNRNRKCVASEFHQINKKCCTTCIDLRIIHVIYTMRCDVSGKQFYFGYQSSIPRGVLCEHTPNQ